MIRVREHAVTTNGPGLTGDQEDRLRDISDALTATFEDPTDGLVAYERNGTRIHTADFDALNAALRDDPVEAFDVEVITDDGPGTLTFIRLNRTGGYQITSGTGVFAVGSDNAAQAAALAAALLSQPDTTTHASPADTSDPAPGPEETSVQEPAEPPAPDRSEMPYDWYDGLTPGNLPIHRVPTPYSSRFASIGWTVDPATGQYVTEVQYRNPPRLERLIGTSPGEFVAVATQGGLHADETPTLSGEPIHITEPADLDIPADQVRTAPQTTSRSSRINAVGYDPQTGVMDIYPALGGRLRYRDITEDEFRALTADQGRHADQITATGPFDDRHVAQYSNPSQPDGLGVVHCPDCGQFTGTEPHTCHGRLPTRLDAPDVQLRSHRADNATITLPGIHNIRDTARTAGAVVFPVEYSDSDQATGAFTASNTLVTVTREGRGRYRVTGDESTPRQVIEAVEAMIEARSVRGAFAAHRAALVAATRHIEGSAEASEVARQAEQNNAGSGRSWAQNPELFRQAVTAAVERYRNGDPPVPYMTEDVTGAPEGGRRFGVEVEFTEGEMRWVAGQLAQAEVTTVPARLPYHWGRPGWRYGNHSERADWLRANGLPTSMATIDQNRWQYEWDRSVSTSSGGGEVVSPILSDTPETWSQLASVVDIIRSSGGRAGAAAGFHVHVSLDDYDHSVENHTALMREIQAAEDILFRLGTNHERGTHRGTTYCAPNGRIPEEGYRSVQDLRLRNPDHRLAVNFTSVNGDADDHVEVRLFDASMDPAVQQAQIKVCLALVSSAFRNNQDPPGEGLRLGDGYERFGQSPDGEFDSEEAAILCRWLDRMFDRDEDKAQVAALLAVTPWPDRDTLT